MITASHRQRGATLLISLILLLIITVLAISSMREVTLEERIVGNLRDQQAAFNGAESALREGEVRLAASIGPAQTSSDCAGQTELCVRATPSASLPYLDWSWWQNTSNAIPYKGTTGDTTELNVASEPRWQTALLGFDLIDSSGRVEVTDPNLRSRGVGPYYYEVNASSQGRSTRTMTALQSVTVQRY
ncbi:PilX N-terminal domain-containing pilus assembly protein [Pseudomonas chengduensis]|nr:PilX N-terminal domain-containing pilus assembly protein [Pseudomonas chengduensis]MDH1866243.1 PilX N-terminal domain-containing pilus assembly protein [Pseudomonas chengduensis]